MVGPSFLPKVEQALEVALDGSWDGPAASCSRDHCPGPTCLALAARALHTRL